MKNLAKKLVNVLGSVSGKVAKSGYNAHQKYHYVMEADLLEAVRGELVSNGIFISSSVEDVRTENDLVFIRVKNTFIDAESGETLEIWSAGSGADKGDKALYKALTGAYKYLLFKNFMLSGDDDPENDGGKAPAPNPPVQPKPAMKVATPAPAPKKDVVDVAPQAAKAAAPVLSAPTGGMKMKVGGGKPKTSGKPDFGVAKVDPSSLPEPAAQDGQEADPEF